MEDNVDWLFNDPLPNVDLSNCEDHLKTEVKCEAGCEEQLHDGSGVKVESTVKEEVMVKVEREDTSFTGMAEGTVSQLDNTLPSESFSGCDNHSCIEEKYDAGYEEQLHVGNGVEADTTMKEEVQVKVEREDTECSSVVQSTVSQLDNTLPSERFSEYANHPWIVEKKDAGYEEQLHDGTGVEAECTVKEEVKVEREDKASVVQSLSACDGCGACVCKCDRAEGSREGVKAVLEGEEYEEREQGKCHVLPHVQLAGSAQADIGAGSLKHAQREQCMEGVGVCEQEQTVDRAAGWGRNAVMKLEGGGVCGREEEMESDAELKDVSQPTVHFEDCKMDSDSCQETGVERLGEGEEQGGEAGVHLQARAEASVATGGRVSGAQWSEDSPAPVASSSLAVSEPRPCVSSEESAQLSPLKKRCCSSPRQQQCRKKARVQSAGGVLCQEAEGGSGPQPDERTLAKDLKKHACPFCDYRCAVLSILRRHVEMVHEQLRKFACPKCQYRASQKSTLQAHIDTVHEGLKKFPCPHCQYRAGQKGTLQRHIDISHEGLRKYPCPQCQFRASTKWDLKTHIETVHEGLRKYPCPHCRYIAGKESNLKNHINNVHEKLRKYPCPHCPYVAGPKGTLKHHIETVHEGMRKYPCPHCQYRAAKNDTLKRHIQSAHGGGKKQHHPQGADQMHDAQGES